VFLSACSTARVADYDEIQGFAQSVFLAGCPNLIAPLWPVNVQATLLFVKEFYKQYKNLTELGIPRTGKLGKCAALAKNALLKEG
jgi:CHAT domain-containing protein